VALLQVFLLLSVSFHQCFIFIFLFILLLSEGQADGAWEPSNITVLFRMSGGGGGLDSVVVSHEILELICRPSCHWLALDNIRIFGYIKRFKRAEFIGRMGMRYVINR